MAEEPSTLREVIEGFINARLEAKLEKLKPDEVDKHDKLVADHDISTWLADAARRASQIQVATHIIKPMSPDAKGSQLYAEKRDCHLPGIVGTHSVPDPVDTDVVGNAAALDVFKFLDQQYAGTKLLRRAASGDSELMEALSSDQATAQALCSGFASVLDGGQVLSSHGLGKQVYFAFSEGDSDRYHLLAPLFPSSLVHRLYSILREHRFGDVAKEARVAHRSGAESSDGYHEYPGLAVQKFGGTKPQNISLLNSQRHGEGWLLGSLPPTWDTKRPSSPLRTRSIFDKRFGAQPRVRELTQGLREFLRGTTYNNLAIREARGRLVAAICDELLLYAAQLRELDAGWSRAPECMLARCEQLWLDPDRRHDDDDFASDYQQGDWTRQVSERFAIWLNQTLSASGMVMGDAEHDEWQSVVVREIALVASHLEAADA